MKTKSQYREAFEEGAWFAYKVIMASEEIHMGWSADEILRRDLKQELKEKFSDASLESEDVNK